MGPVSEFLISTLTVGRRPQAFLDARWIGWTLGIVPERRKRLWAFRLLSLSPHYFIDRKTPENCSLTELAYFEKAAAEWRTSRRQFYDSVLKPRLNGAAAVMDLGCGPGFLSFAIAGEVSSVAGCDISSGALACAQVLNPADNLAYFRIVDNEIDGLLDESVDAVVSLAVIQHLAMDAYRDVLKLCFRKLKPKGRCLLHVQLNEGRWRTEDSWLNDTTLKGKLRYRCGLHNFGRPASEHIAAARAAGFESVAIEPIAHLFPDGLAGIGEQHILVAEKP
ncbi:MAG: methyltransferase domain-containing protein [Acidobacteria bacterium]|nr:methyltransferase domain-containing protein [Acidobacteriota bacterium]MCW5949501.1 methyltransferase domain-containing protein [Pyrinomonadaceae bacterium]